MSLGIARESLYGISISMYGKLLGTRVLLESLIDREQRIAQEEQIRPSLSYCVFCLRYAADEAKLLGKLSVVAE